MGDNDKVGGMTIQGRGKIGKNQRKIGDTGRNPDRIGEHWHVHLSPFLWKCSGCDDIKVPGGRLDPSCSKGDHWDRDLTGNIIAVCQGDHRFSTMPKWWAWLVDEGGKRLQNYAYFSSSR